MENRTVKNLLIILIIVSLFCQGYKMIVMHQATKFVAQVSERFQVAEKKTSALETQFHEAEKKHLKVYLKDFNLTKPKADLKQAKDLLDQARKNHHPKVKTDLANQAWDKVKIVGRFEGDWQGYFQLLDAALAKYQTEPETLKNSIGDVRNYVYGLESERYFPSNFIEPLHFLTLADAKLSDASELSKKDFEAGKPDYLGVYKTCLDGEKIAAKSKEMAAAIPALRVSNENRIINLQKNIDSITSNYERARYAADQLEKYPSYRCKNELENALANLNDLSSLLSNSRNRNQMSVQMFTESAQALSEAEGKINKSLSTFSAIADKWSSVESAISQLSSARAEAISQINRTNSYISDWNENNQDDARNYVEKANNKISEGDRLQNSDPLASLQCFKESQDLAKKGYSEVDDVDHTVRTTNWSSDDDDDDGGGSSIFGGSDSNSSTSSDSGGSYDSGPSGSYDSGPSGSYDSGPSGSYDSGDDGF